MSLASLRRPWVIARERSAPERATDRAERATSGKRVAAIFSVAVLVVVASPVLENWKERPRDDFPLSYYRMFSEERADRQRITYMVGIDAQGNRYLLPYRFAGTGGMNQVRRQMNRLVDQGRASSLCQTAAARVVRAGSRLRAVQRLEVITGTFRLSEYFAGRTAPDAENVRARCSVSRS
jgi:hypothetical protein